MVIPTSQRPARVSTDLRSSTRNSRPNGIRGVFGDVEARGSGRDRAHFTSARRIRQTPTTSGRTSQIRPATTRCAHSVPRIGAVDQVVWAVLKSIQGWSVVEPVHQAAPSAKSPGRTNE